MNETPGSPTNATDPPRSAPTRRRRWRFWLVGFFALALVSGAALASYQLWTLVTAVRQVETAAVVPLPPSAETMPDAPDGGYAVVNVTPVSVDALAPAANQAGAASIPAVAATVVPASNSSQASAPSRLDVLRSVVDASMEDGDPGRSSVWNGTTSLNILIIGIDSRYDGTDQNADVLVIARLDLVNHAMAAVSLPRDLLVEIPGFGQDKINSAYNHGVQSAPGDPVAGVARVRDTVQSVLGIPIDGYILIDFAGFEEIVDSVGGVEVDAAAPIHDAEYPTEGGGVITIDFPEGPQHLDGERALQYVRTRHDDNDDARRERQLQVMMALFDEGSQFRSITAADDLILALSESVQTSFPLDQQLTLARLGFEMDESDFTFTVLTEPLLTPGWTADGRWVYTADMAAVSQFLAQALRTDDQPVPSLSN